VTVMGRFLEVRTYEREVLGEGSAEEASRALSFNRNSYPFQTRML